MWRQIFYYLVKQQSEGLNCVKFIAECYGRNFYHVETLSRRLSWKYLNFWIFISQVVNSQILGYDWSSGLIREGFKKNKFWNIIVWFSGLFWLNCEKKIFLHILLLLWIRNRYFLKMFTFVLHNSLKISVFLEIKMLFQRRYYILLCLKFSFMDVK